MSEHTNWLPPLVLLEEYGGNWESYCEALYAIFRDDFILSQATYDGVRVAIKRHPLDRGREATFWHLIQEGRVEEERLPDLRRCERIRWPRPMIGASSSDDLRCWRNWRRGEERVVIAVGDFTYVVVLAVRQGYVLLWTAYCVEKEHNRRKLQAECDEYRRGQETG
jgi:hypothetical protein